MSTTRKDILDAAIGEFARAGFAGASTTVIAREAQTKQPLLNYHYGSKAKLWCAAVDFAFIELIVAFDSIAEITTDLSPVDVLKLMLRTLNRFASRHPRHVDILRQEMGSNSERTRYLLETYVIPTDRHINAVIEAAIQAGQIKPIPAPFLSSLLFGAVTHFFSAGALMNTVYALDVEDPKQVERHGDWLVDVVFNGLTNFGEEQGQSTNVSKFSEYHKSSTKP